MDEQMMWSFYGLSAVLIILYGVMAKPKGNTLRNLWLVYIVTAAVMGFLMNGMNGMNVWSFYGLCALLIILYGIMGKPKGDTLRNLWLVYIFTAAVMGFLMYS